MKKLSREEVIDIFNFRFATKEFNGDIIPDADMQMIAEAGRLSPSSFGLEPWKFVVVADKNLINEVAEVSWGMQRQASTTSHMILGLTRAGKHVRYDAKYLHDIWVENKGVSEEFFEGLKPILEQFQKANMDIENSDKDLLIWSTRQNYIAMGNMMTAAAMIGVDSCAVEGFDKEKVEEILVKKGILDKENFDLSYIIVFGYRAEEPKREKARKPASEIIEWIK
ncbi:MAG: NAD(P)H-dependent oxidoreductase [Sarcina sp.]